LKQEEQMAANLSKYKKLHRELEDAEERAETITRSYLRGNSVNRYLFILIFPLVVVGSHFSFLKSYDLELSITIQIMLTNKQVMAIRVHITLNRQHLMTTIN
jgi:hypothetical protein